MKFFFKKIRHSNLCLKKNILKKDLKFIYITKNC